MKLRAPVLLALMLAASLSACKKNDAAKADAAPEAAASAEAPSAQPAPAAPAQAATPAASFDLASVPVTTKQLPPFPYVSLPPQLQENDINKEESDFDAAHVLAGAEVRRVEGKVNFREFQLSAANMSPLAAHRNYENALKALGATKVNTVSPNDEAFVKANGGDAEAIATKLAHAMMSQPDDPQVPGYSQYLLRTPSTNIWITVFLWNANTRLGVRVVEEKALEQVVSVVPAAELSSALQKAGHVALYLNFDTDSNVIRQDSLAAVDEVVKLLQSEPRLNLRVEGHTDATGDAAHNRKLSLARAESVVKAITARQIAANRLSAVGKGPDQPLADNASEEGKAKNRRVELVRV